MRADGLGLLDVVDGPNGDDASVRPNQLLAVSLPGSPLDEATTRAVVDVCGRSLLTPLGLRSLSPDDPRYRPYHRGSSAERDEAYHQGTVWPWLLGPYIDASHDAGRARRDRGASRRLGARLGLRDRGRRGAAQRDRLPVPGVVGRRAPARQGSRGRQVLRSTIPSFCVIR